jgi:glycosyltransferase involved in cell wall biosynthesis
MKISVVTGDDLVANPRVRSHARALAAAGHRVTVFGVQSRGTEPEEDEGGVVYVRVRVRAVPHPGLLASMKPSIWFNQIRHVVDAAVERERPEAIHAHDLDVAAPASVAAESLRIPFVYDVARAPYAERLGEKLSGATDTQAFRRIRAVAESLEMHVRRSPMAAALADTETLADLLVHRYGGPRPVVVRTLPPFRPPPKRGGLRRAAGATSRDRLLVLLGPLEEGCGVERAVRALRILGPRHLLVLLGCAPQLAEFERTADALGVAGQVRFVPPAPEDELLRLASGADVALVPTEPTTASNRLGVPARLWTSLAAGLPIVASDAPETAAVVRATGAGVLYEVHAPQDPAPLAEAVHTLLADGSLRATCAEAALAACRDGLNWESESVRLVDVYDAIESGL